MADINNDGYPEIFVTEMLPEPHERLKTKTTFENWDRYQYNVDNGYYHQFTRNMLHLNNGNNTFSEVGRMVGVEATDWSWGALISDLDNDGLKDIFIANGIYQDLLDQDYLMKYSNPENVRKELFDKNPSLEGKPVSLPVVTCGITHGIATFADVWINPGDVIILPEMTYSGSIRNSGVTILVAIRPARRNAAIWC